jgi:hypothetical protein
MTLKTKVSILFLALFLFSAEYALAGFGVSPPYLLNKNLVPGSFYQQDIFLVQSQPTEDLQATVSIDAEKVKDWIKIENGNSFVIPKGTQQFAMKISVSVPPNAELGKYKGTITVNTVPKSNTREGVSVTLGANIAIDLDVTSIQVSDFSIQNFQIVDSAKGSPIKFIIKIKNDGNIENGPSKVALTFFDQYHNEQLDQQEKNVTEKVGSFQTKDISVEFENKLNEGQYWADVKIFNGEQVAVDSKIVFNVTASGVSEKKGGVFSFPSFPVIPLWIYLTILIAVIILVLIFVIIVMLSNQNKLKKELQTQQPVPKSILEQEVKNDNQNKV